MSLYRIDLSFISHHITSSCTSSCCYPTINCLLLYLLIYVGLLIAYTKFLACIFLSLVQNWLIDCSFFLLKLNCLLMFPASARYAYTVIIHSPLPLLHCFQNLLLLISYAGLLPALPLFNSYAGSFDCVELPGREPQPSQCTATCVQLHGSILESVLRLGQILILLVTSPELIIKISTGKTCVPFVNSSSCNHNNKLHTWLIS